MNLGWEISSCNFIYDDGSLPSVDFAEVSTDGLRSIVKYFFAHGIIARLDATIYDNIEQRELILSHIADPVEMVISGRVSAFHCCFTCLRWGAIELPTLGLFVYPDGVDIDYRMGREWSPNGVDAFFRLISHFIELAPNAVVTSAGLPFAERFFAALDHYAPKRRKC